MTINQQILNLRFKDIDKLLREYSKEFGKLNKKTQDNLQNNFNNIKVEYTELNKSIPKHLKQRLDRKILEWQDKNLLKDYFGYKSRLILNKKNVSYYQMLDILILGSYIEQQIKLDKLNDLFFYKIAEVGYNQAIEEIKPKKSIIFDATMLYLILDFSVMGATVSDYIKSLTLSNANEMYKQTVTNIQIGTELNIDNILYQKLIKKQNNRFININGNKNSGLVESMTETIFNRAFLQAGIDTGTKKCKFIAETDDKCTEMCSSLNNQIFNLEEINKYDRYSDIDKRVVRYTTKGLLLGDNLPPINNHFHWCRSSITYLI